jgi:NAD-dependent deacetylase
VKRLVVLSGAGISAESGISTFRDAGGLWEGHEVTQVASPEGWRANPGLVLDFYNQRRKNVREAQPNKAHTFLAQLESRFDVRIVTQNVDDLHERAGSSKVLHLHGEITKASSTLDPSYVVHLQEKDIHLGDRCPMGGQLRPYIVWFGESVPAYPMALELVRSAHILLIIGTSLQVYPAAGLMHHAPLNCHKILVDPKSHEMGLHRGIRAIGKTAVQAVIDLEAILYSLA